MGERSAFILFVGLLQALKRIRICGVGGVTNDTIGMCYSTLALWESRASVCAVENAGGKRLRIPRIKTRGESNLKKRIRGNDSLAASSVYLQ